MGELSVPWMDDEAIRGNRIDSNCGLEGIELKVFGHRPGFRTIRGHPDIVEGSLSSGPIASANPAEFT